jgi:hypothetical protein
MEAGAVRSGPIGKVCTTKIVGVEYIGKKVPNISFIRSGITHLS